MNKTSAIAVGKGEGTPPVRADATGHALRTAASRGTVRYFGLRAGNTPVCSIARMPRQAGPVAVATLLRVKRV